MRHCRVRLTSSVSIRRCHAFYQSCGNRIPGDKGGVMKNRNAFWNKAGIALLFVFVLSWQVGGGVGQPARPAAAPCSERHQLVPFVCDGRGGSADNDYQWVRFSALIHCGL